MKYVLLSGLDGTGLLMQPFIDAFVACNTKLEAQDIIVVDYPEYLHSYNVAIDHARTFFPKSPFVIIAESFSGPIAIKLATEENKNLKAIVFVATFAESPLKLPSNVATLMRFMPTQNKLAAKIILPLLIGKWHSKSFEKLFLNALKQTSANTMAARLRAVLDLDITDDLRQISIASLYLQANTDRLVSKKAGYLFHQHVKNIQLQKIEGPHFLLQANPLDCAKAINTFLEEASL